MSERRVTAVQQDAVLLAVDPDLVVANVAYKVLIQPGPEISCLTQVPPRIRGLWELKRGREAATVRVLNPPR